MIPYFSFSSIMIGPITIQVWGSFVSVGFLFALYLSLKEAKKNNFDQDHIWDVFVIILIGMILGSKVLNIIFNFDKIENIKDIFILSTGGFSFIGGISLSFIFLYIYTKFKKVNIYKIIDNLILGAAVALMMTRIGCFLIYDHIGKTTSILWGR
ncbi:prolipoprotein diacylglyceryl transferase, partial [Candidatus Parcubacteria bacterium]|nr:prolipoprotein diacylglyceryl transferase [Candidatus Parcubacteria bacterium]